MSIELKNVLKVTDPTGFVYYLGTLSPHEIKQLTYVPVVSPSTDSGDLGLNEKSGGYQRAGEAERMERIKKFVMGRGNCLIPPVLLSAREGWEFTPGNGTPEFGSIKAKELAAIIDGQHRLGGLWRVANDRTISEEIRNRPIPFMAVHKLTVDQEKQEFVDINDNQKGVKKSLLRYLHRETKFSGQAANAMMEDEESVFKGRIDIQKKHDWTLFLFGAAQECVDLIFSRDFTAVIHFDPERNYEQREAGFDFILQYWKRVSQCMPEVWIDIDLMPPVGQNKSKEKPGTNAFRHRLLEETGIRAFSKLAAELFSATWIPALKSPSWETIEKYLKAMAAREKVNKVLTKPKLDGSILTDIDPDLKSSGKAGVDAIFRHLKSELTQVQQGN